MKRKYIYPLLIIVVTVVFYYSEDGINTNEHEGDTSIRSIENRSLYLPTSSTGSIIFHANYTLSYSEKHEQPEWVAYELKKEHLSRNDYKRPFFIVDKKVNTSSADWRNYKNSGYDKGHLCPAADRKYTYKAFKETFLTSNISPQDHEFNAGIWNDLEKKTRYWVNRYNFLYVVTGGVLSDNLQTIGYESVSVPDYFYKIILDPAKKQPKLIAFLIPNKKTSSSLHSFVVSVDQIEKLTGIDFFPNLDDVLENELEAFSGTKGWKF